MLRKILFISCIVSLLVAGRHMGKRLDLRSWNTSWNMALSNMFQRAKTPGSTKGAIAPDDVVPTSTRVESRVGTSPRGGEVSLEPKGSWGMSQDLGPRNTRRGWSNRTTSTHRQEGPWQISLERGSGAVGDATTKVQQQPAPRGPAVGHVPQRSGGTSPQRGNALGGLCMQRPPKTSPPVSRGIIQGVLPPFWGGPQMGAKPALGGACWNNIRQ